MMHWRKDGGGVGRAFSALLAVLLAVAMVSPAIVVYADDVAGEPSSVESTGPPEAVAEPAPAEAVPVVEPGVPDEAVAEPSSPDVVEEPVVAPSVPTATPKETSPVAAAPAPLADAAPIETVYADVGSVEFEGWDRTPHPKWSNGQVSGYVEGEWIAFRLTIDNKQGSGPVQVPSMVYKVDHKSGGAVAMDATKGWRWAIESGASGTYTPVVQDSDSDPMYLRTELPEASGFVIPKGKKGFIYFEGHLAISQYWAPLAGASGYPGASAQARLVEWNGSNIGDRTVPFVVGPSVAPTGQVCGLKFEDKNGNGRQDAGEGPLSGFVFHLRYLEPGFEFTVDATSAVDGKFCFTGLPPGSYELTEDERPGYVQTTVIPNPITVSVGTGSSSSATASGADCTPTSPIKVGNRRTDVTKTFSLAVTSEMPAADGYFVRYAIGDATADLALAPSSAPGVYEASVVLPYGTTIASWRFYARAGSEEVPLSGVLGPETLTGPLTNAWQHDPGSISGHKYIDTDGDGQGDAPGAGWLIKLFRAGVFYGQTTTAEDGSYSFTGLLPGSYTVEEAEQDEYLRVWPEGPALGPYLIGSGTTIEGADFVNQQRPGGIEVVKSVAPQVAHVGDTLTYTIDVRNTGEIAVLLTTVTDPLFYGGANLLAQPVLLEPGQALSDLGKQIVLTVPAPDADAVHNTAYAEGQTSFGTVSGTDDADVAILRPGLDVAKTAEPASVTDSGEVTYRVTVTNTGNATLTVDVVDYVEGEARRTLDTGLVLGPGEHKDYEWTETVSEPTRDVAVATGTDALGGEVRAEDDASVAVSLTKTFSLAVTSEMPAADGYFVRYTIGDAAADLALAPSSTPGVYEASVVLPYGTTIAEWRFYARAGSEEVPLSGVLGPETLTGPLTNPWQHDPGSISGHKYEDVDGDGSWGEGENGLAGWTIRLYRRAIQMPVDGMTPLVLPYAWVLVGETTTAEDGSYSFTGLLPGTYRVEEVEQPGWTMTDAPDGELLVESGTAIDDADFGNHKVLYTKTFELTFDAAPPDATFFVRFTLNGASMGLDLEGSGPYSGSVDVEYPYEIGEVSWWAVKDGEEVLLGVTEGEVLEGDTTNSFTYTASVSGHKFSDDDGNGAWDKPDEVGLPGWTIGLYRESAGDGMQPAALPEAAPGFVLYDSTVTDEGGAYAFDGLLPGTYYVAEEQQDGWTQTAAPEGTFVVTNGSAISDLDFGNQEEFLPFTDTEIVKRADKSVANPGDLVTYTLTYSNIGGGVIDSVRIVDDYDERYMTPVDTAGGTLVDGTIVWIDTVPLEPGEERTITYTMRISSEMPEGTTTIRNVAVINPGDHESAWSVRVTTEEPFLPFTGGGVTLIVLAVALAMALGVAIRRKARE
ncbi:MAG: DUF11 domain-containing protein [Coriobacteriia bacterium]|nr:DUF11 domain-containing protein [Coriobacteriia bacterium]